MQERQVSFAGGELAPSLWGRTDLDRYPVGARTLRNFIVSPQGVLVNRPGTKHLAELPATELTDEARVVPFVFSDTDVAVLVFRALQLRVYSAGSGGLIATLTTAYAADEIFQLRFAQVGNFVTIVHPNHAPAELRRNGADWTLEDVDFQVPEAPAWIGESKLVHRHEDSDVFAAAAGIAVGDVIHPISGDSDHPARDWTWQVTRVLRREDGRTYETAPRDITHYYNDDTPTVDHDLPSRVAIYEDWNQKLDLVVEEGDSGAADGSEDTVVASRVYRGRAGRFGYVGETKGRYFWDDGAEPLYNDPPPQSFNPFNVYAGSTLLRIEHPSVVTYFEGRRYFAATDDRPGFVWGSAVENYTNFDEIPTPDDDDALSFQLASNRNEYIRALVPRRHMLVLTSSGEWLISGSGQGEVMTPGSLAAHQLTAIGSANLEPISMSSAVIFLHAKGSLPRALIFGSGDVDGYQPEDISLMARHLFEGYSVVDWGWAEAPFSVLWAVRSDGVLLSCTFVPEQRIVAWATHQIAGDGLVESVAVVPFSDGEDYVFLIVNRGGTRCLEKLANRIVLDVRQGVFLDRSVTQDGTNPWTGMSATIRDTYATGGGVGENVEVVLEEDESTLDAQVGVVLQFDVEDDRPVKIRLTTSNGSSSYIGQVLAAPGNGDEEAIPDDLWDTEIDDFFYCFASMSGLEHLEGQTVSALVDGDVIENQTVIGGALSFAADEDYASWVAIAHVGLPYNSDFESLDAINEKGRQKTTSAITVELDGSRGGSAGPNFDNLVEVRMREVSDSYVTMGLKHGVFPFPVPGRWGREGRAAFRQSKPLPVTLIGFSREISYGGD